MAKKTAKESTPMVSVEQEMKLVRLELPADIHRQFRIAAAEEGVSMAVLARKAVENLLAKRKESK